MYQNYLFDLYGTLVDIHTDEKNELFWSRMTEFYAFQQADYQQKELQNRYKEICGQLEEEAPFFHYKEIELEKVFAQLYREKGVKTCASLLTHTAQVFRLLSTKYINVYDGVFELFKELQEKEKKIYLLSNAQRCFAEYEIRYLNLYHWFSGIVISSDVGCGKPERTIYETILEKYQLRKEECIMIGNDPICDMYGAKMIGIDRVYLHSKQSPVVEERLIEEMKTVHNIWDGNIKEVKRFIR